MERQFGNKEPEIEEQIQDLVKQSFIGGFVTLGLQATSIGLKKNERVAWESAAFRLKQRSSNGVPYWDDDGVGILVVTDQRVIFGEHRCDVVEAGDQAALCQSRVHP